MSPVEAALEALGLDWTEEDVAKVLLAARRVDAPGVRVVSGAERALALAHSGLPPAAQEQADVLAASPVQLTALRQERSVRRALEPIANAASANVVQQALGLSRSGLSRRVSEGRAYAVVSHAGRVFPQWQFVQSEDEGWFTIPGLAAITPHLRGLHPSTVEALMLSPQAETGDRTPRQWLIDGGSPEVVAGLISSLSRW